MFQAVGVSVVAEAASEEAIEVDEAVVGVVAEAEEVTLMVKAARKLKNNQNLNFRSKKIIKLLGICFPTSPQHIPIWPNSELLQKLFLE